MLCACERGGDIQEIFVAKNIDALHKNPVHAPSYIAIMFHFNSFP